MFGESVRALACTLIPMVACIVAGSAVRRGRSGWPGSDMLAGFGLLAGALTILAVTTRIPLSWLMFVGDCASGTAAISWRKFNVDRIDAGFANFRQRGRPRSRD